MTYSGNMHARVYDKYIQLAYQNAELLAALKDAKNILEHLLPTEDPQEQNSDPFETISILCSRTDGAYQVINDAIMKAEKPE